MTRTPLLLAALALAACEGTQAAEGPLEVPPLEYGIDAPWQGGGSPVPPPSAAGRILITNSMDDTLSLLDMDGLGTPGWGELARIPVGLNPVELEGPHHTAVSPAGDFYYVGISNFVPGAGSGPHGTHGTGTSDGYCLKLDARTNRLVGSARVDRNPGDLVVSADGRTLFQTHFDQLKILDAIRRGENDPRKMDARLAILDAQTMTRKAMVDVCPAPHAVRLSLDGRRAYVACWSDELAVVQLDDANHPVTRVPVAASVGTPDKPLHQPYALTVSPTSGAVWVSSLASRTVHHYDPVTGTMDPLRTVRPRPYQGSPMFGAITRDGRTLYMPYQSVDALAVIDTETAVMQREIPLSGNGCLNVHQVELTPDERHGLVVCEGDHRNPGSLLVVDLTEGTVVKSVPVGIFPDSVALLRGAP